MGELETSVRETTGLSTSRYVVSKLDAWDEAAKRAYLTAYQYSDWKTVYSMTADMRGSQYWRNGARSELASVIAEQLGEEI